MVGVNVSNYESFDKALKMFKSKVRRAHIMEMFNQKSQFISKSEQRRKNRQRKRRGRLSSM